MQSEWKAKMRSAKVIALARRHEESGEPMSPWLTTELIHLAEHGAEHADIRRHDKAIEKIELLVAVDRMMERHGLSERGACEALHEANAKGYRVASGGTYRTIVQRERARQRLAFWRNVVLHWMRESVVSK